MSTSTTPGAVPGTLIKTPPVTAIGQIDAAVNLIIDAQQKLAKIRECREHDMGVSIRDLEDVDDKLHDALAALGQ